MATTIMLSESTKELLDMYKEKEHAASFDVCVRELLLGHLKIPKSMAGAFKGMKWTKADRAEFREL
jgi:hypothetical protein